jgi:isoleucyl-tRNA synthetase
LSLSVEKLQSLVLSQTNIKAIKIVEKVDGVRVEAKPDLGRIGRDFGEKTKLISDELANADPDKLHSELLEHSKYVLSIDKDKHEINSNHVNFERIVPEHLQDAEFREGVVYLDKSRTPELEAEGYSREIIRRIQSLRKKQGLERKDEIELFLKVPEDMVDPLGNFEKTIRTITGCRGMMIDCDNPDKKYPASAKEKIKGNEVVIFLEHVN